MSRSASILGTRTPDLAVPTKQLRKHAQLASFAICFQIVTRDQAITGEHRQTVVAIRALRLRLVNFEYLIEVSSTLTIATIPELDAWGRALEAASRAHSTALFFSNRFDEDETDEHIRSRSTR